MSVNYYNKETGELELIAGGTFYADMPVGSIIPYGGGTVQSGFLLCDGAEVLKTAYAELYAVIGDAFGTASDNTKFVLPDLREATTKGVGLSGKSSNHYDSDGVALGEFVEDRNKSHTHDMSNHTHSGTTNGMDQNAEHKHKILTIGSTQAGTTYVTGTNDGGSLIYTTTEVANTDHKHTFTTGAPSNNTTGSSGSATNEVKAVGVNYIIKAKQVAVPTDFAPVDMVENGNMKAVTSNAVYDALSDGKKIKIATPTFATGVTGIAQYHWQRNECTVLMQGVDVPAGFTFNSNFITNLPQAASDAIVQYGVLYVLEWDGSAWQGQVALTNIPAGDTALKADGNIGGASNTVRVYGSFTYRTKDWYEGE